MSTPIFCKLNHNTTLQARGNRVRLFAGGMSGGVDDFTLAYHCVIAAAVNVQEDIVHLLTTNGVYEVNAKHGLVIQKIGEDLL